MLGDPHREDRHLDGEIVDLDAVEILDIDARLVEQHIVRSQLLLPLQDRVLQAAQFLVRDDQEVPRTTSRIENLDARNAVKQALQLPGAVEGSVEFLLELVEEEWLNRLQDIRHRGVVLAQVGALPRGDDRLEHRTENIRVDVQPDLPTELNEQLAGHPRKTGDSQLCVRPEEPTVHIGEARQVGGLLRRVCLVEGREEILDEVRGIGAILKRVGTHRIGELVFGEDPGVLSEIAEQQPGEEHVQAVAGGRVLEQPRVRAGELVEKLPHLLRRADIRMRFRGVLGLLHTGPREEEGEVLVDFPKRESTVLHGLGVQDNGLGVIRDDQKAGAELHRGGGDPQLLELLEQIPLGLAEVHNVLLGDLPLRVGRDVEGAVAQAGDIALGTPVGKKEIKDDLSVIRCASSKGFDAFLNSLQAQPCHSSYLGGFSSII